MSFGRSAHEYHLGVLEIIGSNETVDITKLFLEFNIYESLVENSMTFDVSIIDSLNLFKNVPIIGGETQIHVIINSPLVDSFSSSTDDIDMVFTIYNVSNRHNYKDKTQAYVLHGITPERFTDLHTKINRSYVSNKDKQPNKIATNIFDTYLDSTTSFESEECSNGVNVIFPSHWTPFDGINWLASRAKSNEQHEGVGYKFYENARGYHFKPIESLATQKPKHLLVYEPLNTDANELSGKNSITTYKFDSMYNSLNNSSRGMLHSKLLTHNLTLKTVDTNSFTYDYTFDGKLSHLEDGRLFNAQFNPSTVDPHKLFFICASSKVNDATTTPILSPEPDVIQRRVSRLQETNNIKIQVHLPGNTTIAVGDVVEFSLPNNEPQIDPSVSDSVDEILSGNFLVLTVRHKVEITSYVTVLTIIKDSYTQTPFTVTVDNVVSAKSNSPRRNWT